MSVTFFVREGILWVALRIINKKGVGKTLDMKLQEQASVSCICACDISAYIIPFNTVSYGVEHLAALLCLSVENQPELLS